MNDYNTIPDRPKDWKLDHSKTKNMTDENGVQHGISDSERWAKRKKELWDQFNESQASEYLDRGSYGKEWAERESEKQYYESINQ